VVEPRKDNQPHQSPHRFELTFSDPEALFDPRWFRRRGHRELARVDESGAIPLDGVLFVFDVAKGSLQQPPGTEVLVSFGIPRIYCELVTEVQAHKESLEHQNTEAAAKVRVNLNRMRDEAVVFNEKIKLPVPWTTGIKMVLSGLSERSNGDGESKRTVHHILLQSDLTRGSLKRKNGDFLCTANRGMLGTHWDGSPVLRRDGDGKLYCGKVTCATCLRRASFIMGRPIE
jgi:hypothetical protein